MAYDAGSIVGKIDLETGTFTASINSAIGKTQSMTKSMFNAQAAFALVQKAIGLVTNFVKDSVQEWNEAEKQIALTNATLKSTGNACGMTAKQLIDLSSEIQKTTTFADENVLAAENMLLTYDKIGKDTLPRATKAIADMSTRIGDLSSNARLVGRALQDPVRGLTMLQRMGVTFSDAQKEQIKNYVETNQLAKAQGVILTELEKKYGGSAAALRNTFGGAVQALNNTWGDFQENIGQYVAAVGRPLVENLIQVVEQINKWLTSAEGIDTVAKVFTVVATTISTIVELGKTLVNEVFAALETIFQPIVDLFTEFNEEGEGTAVLIKGLAIAFKVVGGVLKFVADTTAPVIRFFIDLGKAAATSAKMVGAFFDYMGNRSPENAKKLLTATLEGMAAINNMGKNIEDAFKKLALDTAKTAMDIMYDTSGLEAKLNGIIVTESKKTYDSIKATLNGVTQEEGRRLAERGAAFDDSERKLTDTEKEWAEARKTIGETELATKIRQIQDKGAEYKKVTKDMAAVDAWMAQETKKATDSAKNAWQELCDSITDGFGKVQSVVSLLTSQVFDIWNQALTNDMAAVDNDYATRKAAIEANVEDEDERATQLAALDEEYAAKKREIQKKQWIAQQAAAITQAIMNTATGVASAIGMAWMFPFNFVLAGIIGALGAVQVGLIAAQPMPAFASGGIANPGLALVGEKGPEVVDFGQTARVYSNQESRKMFGGTQEASVNFWGDINNDVDVDRTAAIMAAKLEAAMRGAA